MDARSRHPSDSVTPPTGTASAALAPDSDEPGVYRRLLDDGHRFQFAAAVRLLEHAFPDAAGPGTTSEAFDPPVRLRPSTDLVFPATDVAHVERVGEDAEAIEVAVTFLGLYGINSPLPYHFYERLSRRTRDTAAHRDFLDLFNHRFLAFFYRAWKKYRPWLHHEPDGDDRHTRRFVSLAGVGTPHALEQTSWSAVQLAAQARVLGRHVRHAEGLESLLRTCFDGLEVEVVENVPRWVPIPDRSGLGEEALRLGEGAPLGRSVYDRAGKFRLRLGPMPLPKYRSFLPGGTRASRLHDLVRLYGPDHLTYDVELTIQTDALPETQLGGSGGELGYTTRLGTPEGGTTSRIVTYE
jgi:type VI secretion system protein ImpH